jgi:hypothetical protein
MPNDQHDYTLTANVTVHDPDRVLAAAARRLVGLGMAGSVPQARAHLADDVGRALVVLLDTEAVCTSGAMVLHVECGLDPALPRSLPPMG